MGSVNKVILIGNLGRDAELRFTSGGTPVSTVSLATTERFTDRSGQKKEDTQWHRLVIWGKTAEALQEYLVKGKQLYVEGKLQTRAWTDKEGKEQRTTEVRVDKVVLLGGKDREGGGDQRRGGKDEPTHRDISQDRAPAEPETPDEDDIPF